MIRFANFSVINRCNARCKMCNIWRDRDSTVRSLAMLLNSLKAPFLNNLADLTITGGEIFLRPDIPELIQNLKSRLKYLKAIGLNTNGSFPAKFGDAIKSAKRERLICYAAVSIDGDETTHNQIRGINIYEKAIKSLRCATALADDFVKPCISMTVLPENVHLIETVYELAESEGAFFSFRFGYENEAYLNNKGLSTIPLSEGSLNYVQSFFQRYKGDNSYFKVLQHWLLTSYRLPFKCDAGLNSVFIQADGSIFPCIFSKRELNPQKIGYTSTYGTLKNCDCCAECQIWPVLISQK